MIMIDGVVCSKLEKPDIRHLSFSYLTFSFLVSALFQVCRSPYTCISKHGARIDLLLVCIFLGTEGVGAVRTCLLRGIAERNLRCSLYLYMEKAAPSFRIRIFLQWCWERETWMKKTTLLKFLWLNHGHVMVSNSPKYTKWVKPMVVYICHKKCDNSTFLGGTYHQLKKWDLWVAWNYYKDLILFRINPSSFICFSEFTFSVITFHISRSETEYMLRFPFVILYYHTWQPYIPYKFFCKER